MNAQASLFQPGYVSAPSEWDDSNEFPEAYYQGYEDANAGKPEQNPFQAGTADHHEYHSGYVAGAIHFPPETLSALPLSNIGTCYSCYRKECAAPNIKSRHPEQGCASWANESPTMEVENNE